LKKKKKKKKKKIKWMIKTLLKILKLEKWFYPQYNAHFNYFLRENDTNDKPSDK